MNKTGIIMFAFWAVAGAIVVLFVKKRNRQAKPVVSLMDSSEILYSTPTLCDLAPAVDPSDSPKDKKDFVLHEDNWRQIEFVPDHNDVAIKLLVCEVADFERINRVEVGWKNVFVRKEYQTPLGNLNLSFESFLQSFNAHQKNIASIYLSSVTEVSKVKGGFSIAVDGLGMLYGQKNGDSIVELGLERENNNGANPVNAELKSFCEKNHLIVVDWYQRKIIDFKA